MGLLRSALDYFDNVVRIPISEGWLAASHALAAARREGAALLFLRPGTLFLRSWSHLVAPAPRFTSLAAPPHYVAPSSSLLWIPRAAHDGARMALSLAENAGGTLGARRGSERSEGGGSERSEAAHARPRGAEFDATLARAATLLPARFLHLLRPAVGGAAHLGRCASWGVGGTRISSDLLAMAAPAGACVVHLGGPFPPGLAVALGSVVGGTPNEAARPK